MPAGKFNWCYTNADHALGVGDDKRRSSPSFLGRCWCVERIGGEKGAANSAAARLFAPASKRLQNHHCPNSGRPG